MKALKNFLHFLIIGCFSLYGCITPEKPIREVEIQKDLIETARIFYDAFQESSHSMNQRIKMDMSISPKWSDAFQSEDQKLLIIPAHRKLMVSYGEKAYLRRVVFEFNDLGEIVSSGIIELSALSIDYLLNNEFKIINGYLNQDLDPKVEFLWFDLSYQQVSGKQSNGIEIRKFFNDLATNQTNSSTMDMPDCIDWYWVYTYNGVVIGEEYSHTTCFSSGCNGDDACFDDGMGGGGGGNELGEAPGEKLCSNSFNNFVAGSNNGFWHTNINGLRFENGQTSSSFNAYFQLANGIRNTQMNNIDYANTVVIGIHKSPIELIYDIFPHLLNNSDIYPMTMSSGETNWFFSKNAVMEISRWASNHAASGVIATVPNPHLPENQFVVRNEFVSFAYKFLKSIMPGSNITSQINNGAPDSSATYGTNCQ
ncbi:hypothetical protein MM236_04350 [Belliella sp. DSM 107340]|uniref:SLH domain-containing protein n=1 Tax=Belliella calami TaxID=2923436 RepID=A0ABS9UKR4_9BACT|nr:hypothetical protein [Belliella calami]MCH7397204.1 hypothetical protein [Belliella calami]